jgi:hypothetical protein
LTASGPNTVAGDRAQLVAVGADHVGQHVCVTGVALGAGHAVALPVAGHPQRGDRVDPVTGRGQGLYPRATVGLDADHHHGGLVVPADMLAEHRVQPGDPHHSLGQLSNKKLGRIA